VHLREGEKYRNAPIVAFDIDPVGNVKNLRLVSSSGIKDIDTKLLEAVGQWRYEPQPGCGTGSIEMSVSIHFDPHSPSQ